MEPALANAPALLPEAAGEASGVLKAGSAAGAPNGLDEAAELAAIAGIAGDCTVVC